MTADQLVASDGLEAYGLGYRFTRGDALLAVDRLRVRGGETLGELTVRVGGVHVSRATFNLSSLSARSATAKLLETRVQRQEWPELLEQLCLSVLDTERRGCGVELVGTRRPAGERRYLLDPLLPESQPAVLFAPGGAGKSTLAGAVAVSVATGSQVIPGWVPAYPCTPLILDYETTAEEWSKRLAAIAEGAGLKPVAVPYLRCDRPVVDLLERIARQVSDQAIGLVIVDSVVLATGTAREGSGAEEGTVRLHAALRELGTTALLVDHVAATELQPGSTGISKPYGSIFKLNLARSAWELRREHEPIGGVAQLLLVNVKANYAAKAEPIQLRIVHDRDVIRFERGAVTAPELEGRLPTHERMRRALVDGALTAKELATRLSISESSVRVALTPDRNHDLFVKLPDGRIGLQVQS